MKIFKQFLSLILCLFLVGCKASLVDVNVVVDFERYKNSDLGFSVDVPTYYGEPNLQTFIGKKGVGFLLTYQFEDFTFYLKGLSADFESLNIFEKESYKGELKLEDVCAQREDVLNFVQFLGEKCILFDDRVNFKVAFSDLISNTVEDVVLINYPEGSQYSGLQGGLVVPLKFMSGQSNEKNVIKFLKQMETGRIISELKLQLKVFQMVYESITYL